MRAVGGDGVVYGGEGEVGVSEQSGGARRKTMEVIEFQFPMTHLNHELRRRIITMYLPPSARSYDCKYLVRGTRWNSLLAITPMIAINYIW